MSAPYSRIVFLIILLTASLTPQYSTAALRVHPVSTGELIAAVNSLRIANGLAPLGEHPILNQAAQSQADALLATGGQVGHGRPNGITFTQQLLILGYPLAGDLSLGGYRSENFIFGYQLSAEGAVQAWQGDEPHTNTMLSPNRNDIGAGVAFGADGDVYLVIETALSTSSRQPQSDADLYLPGGSGEAANPELALSQYIVPIKVAAARPDGNVFHTVQYGQSLWAIAIAYGTKIDSIRALNNLAGTMVWPNQYLLVMQGATQPAPPPTILPAIGTVEHSAASTSQAVVLDLPTPTLRAVEEAAQPEPPPRGLPMSAWVAVVVVLLLIGGVSAAWFIRDPGAGVG